MKNMKFCPGCSKKKEYAEFYKHGGLKGGLQHTCKVCVKKHNAEYKVRRMELHRLKLYGISQQNYDLMFAAQEGKCAICKRGTRRLGVDHCHKTGKVRGLLCVACNNALGLLQESEELLQVSIQYLRLSNSH
jgi:hypothetical protein